MHGGRRKEWVSAKIMFVTKRGRIRRTRGHLGCRPPESAARKSVKGTLSMERDPFSAKNQTL